MAIYDYVISRFSGLDQSADESLIRPDCSPDEMNFETEGGRLSPASGFAKLFAAPVPGQGTIHGIEVFRTAGKDIFIAFAGNCIYASEGGAWTCVYTYDAVPLVPKYCCVTAQIGSQDYLIIADGSHRMLKFDGESVQVFGSSEGCSDTVCAFAATYRGRLFAAGDPQEPNRLYYSKLPGDGRSIEDWGSEQASPAVEGGHAEIGSGAGDPITGLASLSNQLLIFKKHSVWRLIGDRPSNYTVERVGSCASHAAGTAFAAADDAVYYLTGDGLCCFNGVDAAPLADAKRIRELVNKAEVGRARMAEAGRAIYLLLTVEGAKRLVKYDLSERKYLQFGGFAVFDIKERDGRLLLIGASRCVCEWGRGGSFDGEAIQAHWRTPATDMGDPSSIKSLGQILLRGGPERAELTVSARVGGVESAYRAALPGGDCVLEIPLKNEGRVFALSIANVNGSSFALSGGLRLSLSVRRRTE